MINICAILAEVGGSDTKDIVKGIMQQSYYWHEAYLGDYGVELLHSVLSNAFEDNPEELTGMVIEQGYSAHSRVTMLYALEFMAEWRPSTRKRVENGLVAVAECILHGSREDLPLLNDYVIGTLSCVMIGLKMRSALPLVKEMHDRGLVDESVFGEYEAQLKELETLENSDEAAGTRYTDLGQIYSHYR